MFSNLLKVDMGFELPKTLVAHATDEKDITGSTIFIFDSPVVCAADKRGGAQTTRQIDALLPPHISLGIDALVLSGGSAFGLNSATPVVDFLREQGKGFGIGKVKVPRVPTACIFDLTIGNPVAPSYELVYRACEKAKAKIEESEQGCIGAGTGATVGKLYGIPKATKTGLGFAFSEREFSGIKIKNAVFVVLNAFGNIVSDGKIIAGVRGDREFFDFVEKGILHPPQYPEDYFSSTVLTVGITEGIFTIPELSMLAQTLNAGVSFSVKPAHTPFDGDISFAISLGLKPANLFDIVGEFYRLTKQAIINAVNMAKTLGGVPSASDIVWNK